jgi:hypothetical protein
MGHTAEAARPAFSNGNLQVAGIFTKEGDALLTLRFA